tara:strand:- start:25 stop:381 length:357 start_codon:yes stop_codon:yes gene_type:complete
MKKRKPNKYQKIISKFFKDKASAWSSPKQIKTNMFLAKKMLEMIPEEEFWEEFPVHKNCEDLSWFFTDEGKKEVRNAKLTRSVKLPEKVENEIGEEKLGEDFKIEKKPKTIKDWLNDA